MPTPAHGIDAAANRRHAIALTRIQAGMLFLVPALAAPPHAHGQHITVSATAQASAPRPPETSAVSAKQWATDAANHEIEMIHFKPPLLRYHEHIVDNKGNQLRDVIETQDGTVARLIGRDNRPLTPEEDSAERQRLSDMLESPSAFYRHVKNDQAGKKTAVDLLEQFPSAMIYTFAPGQPQHPHPGARLGNGTEDPPEIVVDFTPDPKWSPPSLASDALTGLRGRVWIDARSHHITHLEAEVFQQVNFGWGIFAHVYPGGKFMLDQVDVEDQRWIFTRFTESLVVRAVMVKTMRENSDIEASQFSLIHPVPYQDAIRLLLNTPLPKN